MRGAVPILWLMCPAHWTSGLVELALDEPIPLRDASGPILRRAVTREDWAAVRALRFAAMVREGDLAPSALPIPADPHDAATQSASFLLVDRGRILGSTRCSHADAEAIAALPCAPAFGKEVEQRIGGAAIVEASLTVVDRTAERARTLMRLFKAHTAACAALEAEWLVAAVAEGQMGFYRRVFDMQILTGATRPRGFALPRVLMGIRCRDLAAMLHRRLPFLAPTAEDLRCFSSGAELRLEGEDAGANARRARAAAGDACA